MIGRLDRRLDSISSVYAACAASLALGLIFVFVWPPHPWGWRGIDQYHELARGLARGEPFATTDVPWGYAYYIAAFYSTIGEVLWAPLVGQVLLNATAPLLLYHIVRRLADARIAVLSATLLGIFSFNTVYTSTQSSDSICTVGFLAMLLTFIKGAERRRAGYFALSGLLAGVVPQFRPNLILFPFVLCAVYLFLRPRGTRKLLEVAVFLLMTAAALAPWTIRNYRLTGMFLPTSTHGGVQLWYGTVQVGPYLEERPHNPRSFFEPAPFDYTSIPDRPIVVSASVPSCGWWDTARLQLVYWTNRQESPHALDPQRRNGLEFAFEIPPQPLGTTVYYYFDTLGGGERRELQTTPAAGREAPYVYFVAASHVADLDMEGDLLDVFDLIRMLRHIAWNEPVPFADRLDFSGDGRIDRDDVQRAIDVLLTAPGPIAVAHDDARVTLSMPDGSSFVVPKQWSTRVTDVEIDGNLAGILAYGRRSLASLRYPPPKFGEPGGDPCRAVDRFAVNEVFYRKEPHLMLRYTALAWDNITRDPLAFAAASLYRMGRLFVIWGSEDRHVSQQFAGARLVYTAGLVLSLLYLAFFIAGVWIAWRRRLPLLVLLIAIAYVPLTIGMVLTNMRYTITVQPLMFAFVALALLTISTRRQSKRLVPMPPAR